MRFSFASIVLVAGAALGAIASAIPNERALQVGNITELAIPAEGMLLERQAGLAGPARDVLGLIQSILDQVKRDNKNRETFTKEMVTTMGNKYPAFNFVVCHVKHTYQWNGVRGRDWDHWHQEFDIQIGGTIGYEMYWARSGTFTRLGDGGFINWAYFGNVEKTTDNGSHVIFRER